jgi:hypothetical protein
VGSKQSLLDRDVLMIKHERIKLPVFLEKE